MRDDMQDYLNTDFEPLPVQSEEWPGWIAFCLCLLIGAGVTYGAILLLTWGANR